MRFGPLVDCDVHQEMTDPDGDLFPYLTSGWQEYVLSRRGRMSVVPGVATYTHNPFGYDRKDAQPPDGGKAGASRELMVEQLLDPYDVRAAILTGGEVELGVSGINNPYFAAEVARAVNDRQIEHWLDWDPRFKGSVMLALQVPDWAAAEIRRVAGHGGIVQVCASTNPLPFPFGHPIYDPVHRACAETGLPFAIHTLGDGYAGALGAPLAGGLPTLYLEFHTGAVEAVQTHLMSFVFHGVFDRYPTLRLALLESGVGWIPSTLRRMDENFKGLRREVPWCKRLPSEHFMERVLVSTQPLDADPDDELIRSLGAIGAEDVLAFASDYPHWDTDVPTRTAAVLPERWRDRVLRENATRFYGLTSAVPA